MTTIMKVIALLGCYAA